jgi:hypothetical protein
MAMMVAVKDVVVDVEEMLEVDVDVVDGVVVVVLELMLMLMQVLMATSKLKNQS